MTQTFVGESQIRTLSMGPQHPSMHGVLRLELTLDGEVILQAKPDIGFLHRGVEKMAESRTYAQFVPYPDRLDYVASFSNNLAYCQAVEKLAQIEVPRHALWLRSLFLELQRIASHLIWLGTFGLDVGAWSLFLYTFREEWILDLFEMTCGARLTYSMNRIGGLAYDLPDNFDRECRKFLRYMPDKITEYDNLFSANPIVRVRLEEVGLLPTEKAISFGASGPTLRGSGVAYDVRKAEPFAAYSELDFVVPTQDSCDCYGRYLVRIEEMRQSLRLIEQVLDGLPEGEVLAKGAKVIRPPVGETYSHIEAPRGDFGVFLVSDGKDKPVRTHLRAPTFSNLSAVGEMAKGAKIADIVAIIGSIDIVLGEVDR